MGKIKSILFLIFVVQCVMGQTINNEGKLVAKKIIFTKAKNISVACIEFSIHETLKECRIKKPNVTLHIKFKHESYQLPSRTVEYNEAVCAPMNYGGNGHFCFELETSNVPQNTKLEFVKSFISHLILDCVDGPHKIQLEKLLLYRLPVENISLSQKIKRCPNITCLRWIANDGLCQKMFFARHFPNHKRIDNGVKSLILAGVIFVVWIILLIVVATSRRAGPILRKTRNILPPESQPGGSGD